MKKSPIGVYDSGIGGLTVLKALREKLPNEDFIYFADTANLPYGDKQANQIIDFSRKIISDFVSKFNTKMVVAACNTSTVLALDTVTQEFKIPIIGTVLPIVNYIINTPKHNKIKIICTTASANSRYHEKILKQYGFEGEVTAIACPDFVPLIESTPWDKDRLKEAAQKYLKDCEGNDIIIYGCTHYPLIEEFLPQETQYIDPAHYIAHEAHQTLEKNDLLNNGGGSVQFICSGDKESFAEKIKFLLGIDL